MISCVGKIVSSVDKRVSTVGKKGSVPWVVKRLVLWVKKVSTVGKKG